MRNSKRFVILIANITGLFCLFVALGACAPERQTPYATPSTAIELKLYFTETPTPAISEPTATWIPRTTPAPTPTPFTHQVVEGDTLLGLAFKYGISLEDLLAANPGVEPRLLPVGSILIIPIKGESQQPLASATPIAVDLKEAACYSTGDQGYWCVLQVVNRLPEAIENLSVWIELLTQQGEVITGQEVTPPLNRIKPGDRIPLMAYFPPPQPIQVNARAQLLTALAVGPSDGRYLEIKIQVDEVDISEEGNQAVVSGTVRFQEDTPIPAVLWIVAVAFDQQGQVVGMRKWELLHPCSTVTSGEVQKQPCPAIPFQLSVYSLGPVIGQVDVLGEARP